MEVYCAEQPALLCIADLGCSSAKENNLGVISELIRSVDKARRELGHGPQEYQIYLNDLPMNDFNTVFRAVTKFENKLKQQIGDDFGHCFVNGVPGSFYGRLFPSNSLHFVHSSSSLHWLSQGFIEEEKLNTFNLPLYAPSLEELKYLLEKDGSFAVEQVDVFGVSWEDDDDHVNLSNKVAKAFRVRIEPLLISHSDETIIEEVFHRHRKVVHDSMSNEKNMNGEKNEFINVTVSLIRRPSTHRIID